MNGPALPVVDFHTHFIDGEMEHVTLPGCVTLRRTGTAGQLYRDGSLYRKIDHRSWNLERRIADMDAEGVSMQVLSPIPATYAYDAVPADAVAFSRAQNDALARVVRRRPDRFAALGSVALQDVDRACAEVTRALRELGLSGVEIGTSIGGRELDDPAFEPFWECCEALDAIVFIHPESAPGFDRLRKRMLIVSTGYPSETGIAAAALLTSGLLERRRLRIVLAHAGGTLPWLLPRLDRLWEISPELRVGTKLPSEAARSFYCDTLTFSSANLAIVLERFGPSQLVVGSDYPFSIREVPPGAVIADHPNGEALRVQNALRLLGREDRDPTAAR